MSRRVLLMVLFALASVLPGCDVALSFFAVPTQAWSGSVFAIEVGAGLSGSTGAAGCVLQIPNAFTVVGTACTATETVFVDQAVLLSLYTAESGTHLTSFQGAGRKFNTTTSAVLQVFLRSAPGQAGTFQFKVALAGNNTTGWFAQDPPLTQFAAITAPTHVKTLTLVGSPLGDHAIDSDGLPCDVRVGQRSWTGIACADIDADGNTDIAAVNRNVGARCWLSQPGASANLPATNWSDRSAGLGFNLLSGHIAVADLDKDGALDLVAANGLMFFGNGGSSWTAATIGFQLLQPAASYRGVAVGDIDHDGFADIAVASHESGTVQVLLNNGNRTFRDSSAGLPNFGTSQDGGDELLLVDLTGDGNLDLFWARLQGPYIWLGDGAGGWTQANAPVVSLGSGATAIDLDGNGVPEIVTSRMVAIQHTGGASFGIVTNTGLPATVYGSVVAVDFDRDGNIDIAAGRGSGGTSNNIDLWRNNGLGQFALHTVSGLSTTFIGGIADLEVCDLNGDNWPDLVAAVDGVGVFAFQNLRTGVSAFGAGCAGTGAQGPVLAALGAPSRGNAAFALRLSTNVGNVLGGFWFDADRRFAGSTALPLDLSSLGAPGCSLLVGPQQFLHLGLIDAAGNLVIPLPVPPIAALERATFFGQGCACIPTANAAGSVLSAGIALRIN